MPPKSKSDLPKCCGCERQIKTCFNANLHPLLKVLVCKKCYNNYGTGDFSVFDNGVDANGDDNYCRLCVDGGDLFFCGNTEDSAARCHYGFCRECITRVCPNDPILRVEPDDTEWKWVCLSCDPDKLEDVRKAAQTTILRLSQRDLDLGDLENGAVVKKRKTGQEAHSASFVERSKQSKLDSGQRKEPDTPTQDKSKTPAKADDGQKKRSDSPQALVQEKSKSASTDVQSKKRETDSLPVENSDKTKSVEADATTTKKPERTSMSSSEKLRISKVDANQQREPEATSMPQVEKPRPPKTSLRNLGGPKISLPLGKTPSASPAPAKPPSTTLPQQRVSTTPTPQSKLTSAPTPAPAPAPAPVVKPTTAPTEPTKSQSTIPKAPPTVTIVTPTKSGPEIVKPQAQTHSQAPTILKSRPVSKQLKVNSETVTPKIVLTEMELKKRLEHFGVVKDHCIKEIDSKFATILEMFASLELENKSLIKCEIEDIRRPLQEINNMIINLETLCQTQI